MSYYTSGQSNFLIYFASQNIICVHEVNSTYIKYYKLGDKYCRKKL